MAENLTKDRLLSKLTRELGPAVKKSLDSDDVAEVMLNNDGVLWEDNFVHGMREIGTMSEIDAVTLIGTVASSVGQVATHESPIVQGVLLTHNARFQGVMPPVAVGPVFAIRKRASRVFKLAEYVEKGLMTQPQREALEAAIVAARNIVIVGGTGSGKTTLANAVLDAMADLVPDTRVAIIEDTAELQCNLKNKYFLATSQYADTDACVFASLRLRPDRIIVGEVRNSAANSMLKAWNTGHPGGLCTVHANDAKAGIGRLVALAMEAPNTPREVAMERVAEGVDVIVSIQRDANGARRVREMVEVKGFEGGVFDLASL
uniref:P-type conjugative transfer ATPase TrbB n=1 Tax=Cupriavidus gilardii TaxID=82541 RepID=UPI002478A7C9|nr:P-type conjugative transfer ATPase TrbB [Cupriavidus gilardii]WDE72639.1 Conjugative transfer protein TrbB [Cupriavidus gilardii]